MNHCKWGEGMIGGYNLGDAIRTVHRITAYHTTHYDRQERITMKGGTKALDWVKAQLNKGRKVVIEASRKPKQFGTTHWEKVVEIQTSAS